MTRLSNDVLTLRSDPRLQVQTGQERLIVNGGLQPFVARTSAGVYLAQTEMPETSYAAERITFHWMIGSFVSRDDGATWERVEHRPGRNELYMEGGTVTLPDGSLYLLDTYLTPGPPGEGRGLSQRFSPDLRAWTEPREVTFDIPHADFAGVDDGGNPHHAQRLHRRILALPDGDLLATFYGWFAEDRAPFAYMPNARKSRCMLLRSSDEGHHWRFVSTIAGDAGTDVGSEGYCEPDLVRISSGPHIGRLLCLMRTGRELRRCHSDDEGATWSDPVPEQFGFIDVNDPSSWRDFFADTPAFDRYASEMEGTFVDPNLIELRNGVVACAFGLRIPEKVCWSNPHHERNGNYVAFSFDHGESWSHLLQITSGVMTTHYMTILETAPDTLQVIYDCGGRWEDGYWDGTAGRYTAARDLQLDFTV